MQVKINVTRKYIERQIADKHKKFVKYTIKHLTKENKIKRIKGFGPDSGRIEYYYKRIAG